MYEALRQESLIARYLCCHSRESGHRGQPLYHLPWTSAFALGYARNPLPTQDRPTESPLPLGAGRSPMTCVLRRRSILHAEARRSSRACLRNSLRCNSCRGALRAPVAPLLSQPGFVARRARAARPCKRRSECVSANPCASASPRAKRRHMRLPCLGGEGTLLSDRASPQEICAYPGAKAAVTNSNTAALRKGSSGA